MTTTTQRPINQVLAGLGKRCFTVIGAIANASQAARCSEEARRLFRLSDADLARRGLNRGDIIPHTFTRYLYT